MTQPIRPGMFNRAAAEARKLEHSWIGPEHFLLALLAEPSPATDALAAVDVTYERFETHLRGLRYVSGQPLPAYDPERTLSLNPAAHDLRGLAKGFAIASGSSRRQPLHWLLAMIYMDHTPATHLDSLGSRPERSWMLSGGVVSRCPPLSLRPTGPGVRRTTSISTRQS